MVHPHVSDQFVTLIESSFAPVIEAPLVATSPSARIDELRQLHGDSFRTYFDESPITDRITEWDNVKKAFVPIDPYYYGNVLVRAAYFDTRTLTTHAESHIIQTGQETDVAKQLKASRALLRIAGVSDEHKQKLLELVKTPFVPQVQNEFNEASGNIMQHLGDSGPPRVEWTPGVDAWIRARSMGNAGCPAAKTLHAHEGSAPASLLYNFWDRVITRAYEQSN